MARYYLARRVGGRPTDCGWKSQAVSLVPIEQLPLYIANDYDRPLVDALRRLVTA